MKDNIINFRLPYINSNMYILCKEEDALVVDPIFSKEAYAYLQSRGTKKITVLLTHEHYDHTCGINELLKMFQCYIVCHENCANALKDKKNNRPVVMAAMLLTKNNNEMSRVVSAWPREYTARADKIFKEELEIYWFGHQIKMKHTPGHSPGSCCIEMDQKYVFTGDSYIADTPVILSLPGGNEEDYLSKTEPYLKSIGTEKIILSGHGENCFA